MAKYNLRWTDDELTVMSNCITKGLTLKETVEVFEGTNRTKGAISAKRRAIINTQKDSETEEIVDEVNNHTSNVSYDSIIPVEKEKMGIIDWLIVATATLTVVWLLTEGNYIDWS